MRSFLLWSLPIALCAPRHDSHPHIPYRFVLPPSGPSSFETIVQHCYAPEEEAGRAECPADARLHTLDAHLDLLLDEDVLAPWFRAGTV